MGPSRNSVMPERGLGTRQRVLKRSSDLVGASIGLLVTWPVIVIAAIAARIDTGESGIFTQERVGRGGKKFRVMKVRTMRSSSSEPSTVTTTDDTRVTRLGRLLRDLKVDELPQLLNVVRGDMSLVGPRPDVPGFADVLDGTDRLILTVRPGITGPAALAYRHEEQILASVDDPEWYNREIIWPDKVQISLEYVSGYTLMSDVRCLRDTIRVLFRREGRQY